MKKCQINKIVEETGELDETPKKMTFPRSGEIIGDQRKRTASAGRKTRCESPNFGPLWTKNRVEKKVKGHSSARNR